METKLFNVKAGGAKSGNINKISYFEDEEIMHVKFKNGSTYQYEGVPKRIWEEASTAKSIGSYMHQSIIGVYESKKI